MFKLTLLSALSVLMMSPTFAADHGGQHADTHASAGNTQSQPHSNKSDMYVGVPQRHQEHVSVSPKVIADQRAALARNTAGKGFGPQAPRDIDNLRGENPITFNAAPPFRQMNLCNIHFHKNAEHKGGEFTTYAGDGDGHGYLSGYQYDGRVDSAKLRPVDQEICPSTHGSLYPGDTIEVHYVYSTAQVKPGPTLASCLSEANKNPQLRVEAQVYVLVNDATGVDFTLATKLGQLDGLHQAMNVAHDTGRPVQYIGSTTGPVYDEVGSPFQVSWGVRPRVAELNIKTLGQWCRGNVFNEDHAHGVRNLVINPDLLSDGSQGCAACR